MRWGEVAASNAARGGLRAAGRGPWLIQTQGLKGIKTLLVSGPGKELGYCFFLLCEEWVAGQRAWNPDTSEGAAFTESAWLGKVWSQAGAGPGAPPADQSPPAPREGKAAAPLQATLNLQWPHRHGRENSV